MAGGVYSYMRWSSDRQQDGSTEERQRAAQKRFCQHYGLTLVEELTDAGVSSYRGCNYHEGKLGEVIARAKRGEIPAGSLLLFENADRMTRMGLSKAVPLFFEILGAGLKIGIADRLQIYTPGTLDLGGLMTILVDMERANAESSRKSGFSRNGWAKNHLKMEEGQVVTGKAPQWLEVVEGKFVERDTIVAQIQALFAQSLQYGVAEACRRVNAEHGSTWKIHQVQYLLKNRRVIGEHTITNYSETAGRNVASDRILTDYYPPIIDKNLFAEVQAVIASRKPFAGKQDANNLNIYRGLLTCAACGGSVRFMVKTAKEYFLCTNSMTNTCKLPGTQSIRGEHLRRLLFKFEHWSSLKSYFMEHSDDLKTARRKRDELLAAIDKIATRVSQMETRLMDEDDPDKQGALLDILAKAKGSDRETRDKLSIAEAALASLEDAFTVAGMEAGARVEWMLGDRSEEASLERARINRWLNNIFESLVLDYQAKTLTTIVKPMFKGKVAEFTATVTTPPDKRFTPVTGPRRIGGKGTVPKVAIHEDFTDEELAAMVGVQMISPAKLLD